MSVRSVNELSESELRILDAEREIWPSELSFPEPVYAERLDLVQQDLLARGLSGAILFDPENMFWLAGYQTIGYFTFQAMFVPTSGKPVLITRVVNRDMALALPTIADAVAIFDTQDHVEVLAGYLLGRQSKARLGLEITSRYLNIGDYNRLSEKLGGRLTPWTGVIEEQRMVKSEDELVRMRRAARAVEAGMEEALKTIAVGKTDNDLAAALYRGSIAAGSEYIGHPPMVVSGPRSELCFALWKRNTIEKGDVVLLEGAGCVDRYHAMMSRSAVVGPPSDEHKATADALIEILEAAVENIRPGAIAGEVDFAVRSRVEKRGLGRYFKSRTAYGIGIGFPPNWAEGHIYSIRPHDPLVLKPNMTFHIIPTMFRKGFGMAISDSVRVTENGCELLTNHPRDLLIVN
ncbi:M24 family metallopeptidase [Oceanibium sediminis]|uniref:M24 family metallopeptidase n=1 Tax=Oceanibium sediminis TaxID=2026339 RepID=UPI000DD3A20D|nr:Xaa-Pro peptidase family protein [Oceanibium sediminis]